jgi:hypothetical protein
VLHLGDLTMILPANDNVDAGTEHNTSNGGNRRMPEKEGECGRGSVGAYLPTSIKMSEDLKEYALNVTGSYKQETPSHRSIQKQHEPSSVRDRNLRSHIHRPATRCPSCL